MSGGLVVVGFAGGGGSSLGIEQALGRPIDIGINHDPQALAIHQTNHPTTEHYSKNIWQIDPLEAVRGRPVELVWMSPDCVDHSKAKGGRPVRRHIRDLAWVVVLWAKRARPRVIFVENVEEFRLWGPVDHRGRRCPERRGETFKRWVAELRRLGYRVEWRELRACDYGAPTIRKRLFLVARRDGHPIVWPEPTHGPGRPLPYRTAAEIIDWSRPCPSIFLTREQGRVIGVNRPLAEATMRRIARGVKRYVLDAAQPFIVPITHHGSDRVHSAAEPLRTITTAHRGEFALVAPYFVQRYGERPGQDPRTRPVTEPIQTVVPSGNGAQLAAVHLTRFNQNGEGSGADEPVGTVMAGAPRFGVVAAFLAQHNTGMVGHDAREPISTVTGTVEIAGEPWVIADIGMRMLSPRELFAAQGFPQSYIIDPEFNGRPLTKTAQIRAAGNSVCPPVAAALVRANCTVGAE